MTRVQREDYVDAAQKKFPKSRFLKKTFRTPVSQRDLFSSENKQSPLGSGADLFAAA